MNTLYLIKAIGKFIFNINRRLGIVRQLFMRRKAQTRGRYPQNIYPPGHTRVTPHFKILLICIGANKVLHFRLLEFTHAENKTTRRYFISKRLTDLGDTKRQLVRTCIQNIFKINISCCRSFGPQIGVYRTIGHCTD